MFMAFHFAAGGKPLLVTLVLGLLMAGLGLGLAIN
jgi:hypothetical protein